MSHPTEQGREKRIQQGYLDLAEDFLVRRTPNRFRAQVRTQGLQVLRGDPVSINDLVEFYSQNILAGYPQNTQRALNDYYGLQGQPAVKNNPELTTQRDQAFTDLHHLTSFMLLPITWAARRTEGSQPGSRGSRERIRTWLEVGDESPFTMGVYGTSVENLKQIAQTNEVPQYPNPDLPYMQEYTQKGKLGLYFYFPWFAEKENFSPYIHELYIKGYMDAGFSRENAEWEVSTETVRRAAKGYAVRQALTEYVFTQTGIRAGFYDLAAVGLAVSRQRTSSYLNETGWSEGDAEDLSDSADVKNILASVERRKLRTILQEGMRRRGVLLFASAELQDEQYTERALQGYEDESEFLLLAKSPPYSADLSVVGAEVFSSRDLELALGKKK